MGEDIIGDTDVQLPPPPETGILVVDRTMAWVRNNYNDLVTMCDERGLPRPPHW
jgi:hypothetical protein